MAVVLGSGWAPAADALGTPTAVVPMAELPGFTPPTAAGHGGQVLSVPVGDTPVLVLLGRIHAYEGHELRDVVHPVRTACAAGARRVVLTNAAGGLRADYHGRPAGADQRSPEPDRPFAAGRARSSSTWSTRIRRGCGRWPARSTPTLAEGVYAGLPGPHYETPAEIRMLRTLGADLVGMSTVHETIAARAAGARGAGGFAGDEPGGRHDGRAAQP